MRQVARRQWTSSLAERDLYRVLAFRYESEPSPRPRREVIQRLQTLLSYRDLTRHQLRRLVERALNDPRTEELLQVEVFPPTDSALGDAVQGALPSLQEVIVIPSLEHLDNTALPLYLGIVTAHTFTKRFVGGQGIGLGYGRAIHAFVKSMRLPSSFIAHLQFFALAHCPTAAVNGWGAENLLQLIADYWALRDEGQLQGYIAPTQLQPEQLHWAFVEVETVRQSDRWQRLNASDELSASIPEGAIAEVVGHLLRSDGRWLGHLSLTESVPLPVLRRMVETGRNVVALAGGASKAPAILAAVRAGIINRLVTDDRCAIALLHLVNPRFRAADLPSRPEWWEVSQRFFVAHLRYRKTPRQSVKVIAAQLRLSPKTVRRIVDNLQQRKGEQPAIVKVIVRPPSEAMALEMALLQTLRLQEVRVVAVTEGQSGLTLVGETAAELFFDLARNRQSFTVGLGGGRTINAMVNALKLPATLSRLPKLQNLNIWALDSNPLPKVVGISAHTLVASLAMRCLPSANSIVHCFAYQDAEQSPTFDAIFIGFGVLAPGETLTLYAEEIGLPVRQLQRRVAGATLFQCINADGEIVPSGFEGKVVALPLTVLQRMVREGKPVIVVASGAHKAPALLAAHRARLFNGLVVDDQLAQSLLSLLSQ